MTLSHTWNEVKTKPKQWLWEYGILTGTIDDYAVKIGYNYYDRATILEMVSVLYFQHDNKTGRSYLKEEINLGKYWHNPF